MLLSGVLVPGVAVGIVVGAEALELASGKVSSAAADVDKRQVRASLLKVSLKSLSACVRSALMSSVSTFFSRILSSIPRAFELRRRNHFHRLRYLLRVFHGANAAAYV